MEQTTSPNTVNQVVDQVVNTLLALQNETTKYIDLFNEVNVNENKIEPEEDIKKLHDIQKIRCGWTINDCGTLSVGDLYLMFGCDSKIILEYSWDLPIVDTSQINGSEKSEEKNAQENGIETSLNTDNTEEEINKIEHTVDLANTLKRLISVAKLHYRKNIIKCPCGHVCNGNKPNVSKTKPSLIKPVKVPEHKTQETEITTTNEVNIIPKAYQPITPAPLFRMPNVPNDTLKAQLDVSIDIHFRLFD